MCLWVAFPDILRAQGASRFVGISRALPVLSVPNSISSYMLDNGIAVPNRKGINEVSFYPWYLILVQTPIGLV